MPARGALPEIEQLRDKLQSKVDENSAIKREMQSDSEKARQDQAAKLKGTFENEAHSTTFMDSDRIGTFWASYQKSKRCRASWKPRLMRTALLKSRCNLTQRKLTRTKQPNSKVLSGN
jgi:hypothetical protein